MPARQTRRELLLCLAACVLGFSACRPKAEPLQSIDALISRGKTEQALQSCEQLLLRNPHGDLYWEAALRKAELLQELNRPEDALAWLKSVLPSRGASAKVVTLLIREQAAIERDLGHYRDSALHLTDAIEIARTSGQQRMVARLQIRRAYVLIQLDRIEDARQCLSSAEDYARLSGDHSLDAYILNYRGVALMTANHFEDAISVLEMAAEKFRRDRQDTTAAEVLSNLAWCYFRLGRFDKALGLENDAQRLANPADQFLILGALGNIFYEERSFSRAAELYKLAISRARGRNRDFETKWLNNLTAASIEQGKWPEAEQFNQQALQLQNGIDTSQPLTMALVNSGRIQSHKGHYGEAEQTLKRAAASRTNIAGALDAYAALANLYERIQQPTQAKTQFESALQLADRTGSNLREDENKLSYLSSLVDLHRQYVNFLMNRGDKASALAVAESSRSRVLRERLNLSRSKSRLHTLAEYQEVARNSGATILAYWIGPEKSYLWVISAKQFESYPLPLEHELSDLVERYQTSFEHGGSPRIGANSVGARLFQLLLAPYVSVLQPSDKYLIVPDGPLYGINFETLPVPGTHPHFWIEDTTVAVAPSLDLLLERHAAERRDRSLLLVGDAVEWSTEFPKLLYARKEMEAVETYFPGGQQKVLAGANATPVAYERSQPRKYAYIHFAAHATANKNSPFDSSIILSPGDTGSKLSAKEVLGTPIDAELVTISACHSAGARNYWGEGLVGLAWAFLQSGAHDVIAGLWDVSDYSSPILMKDFYARLAASRNPAGALRAAKLDLLRGDRYVSPYYWGTFQLYEGILDLR